MTASASPVCERRASRLAQSGRPPESQPKYRQRPVRTPGATLRSPCQQPAARILRRDRTRATGTRLSYRRDRYGRGHIREWPAECTCPPLQPQARLCPQDNQHRWKGTGQRTREVTLDPGASANTPARNQGSGRACPDRTRAIPCTVRAVTPHRRRAACRTPAAGGCSRCASRCAAPGHGIPQTSRRR